MSIRRRAAALGAVSLGLIALSACEKPTPLATVTVGTKTVTTEAASGCYDGGKALSEKTFLKCLQSTPEKSITVHPGDQVRIGVDPAIADKGWLVAIGLQGKTERLTQTYRSFNSDALFTDAQSGQQSKEVTINFIQSSGGQNQYEGVWQIKLKRAA